MAASDDVNDALREAALGPAAVTVDGRTTQQQPLDALIRARDALRANETRSKGALGGIRFIRMIPGGTVSE